MIKEFLENKIRFGFGFDKKLSLIESWSTKNSKELELVANNVFFSALDKVVRENKLPLSYSNTITFKSVRDLYNLSHLNKDEVRLRLKDKSISPFLVKGYTSGTTGSPLTLYRDVKSIQWENAYVWWYRIKNGYSVGDSSLWIRGDVSKGQKFVKDKYTNTLKLSYYDINPSTFEYYFDLIKKHKPKVLICFPSAGFLLASFIEQFQKELKMEKVFTSSEFLYDFQIKKMENVFGAKVFDWYGNAERVSAFSLEDGVYKSLPLYSILDFKKGYHLGTSLINMAFPLVNYRVNDNVVEEPQSEFLKEVVSIKSGRTDVEIIFKDGTRVSNFNMIFKFVEGIKLAQIVQLSVDDIQVRIIKEAGFTERDFKEFEDKVYGFLGDREELSVVIISIGEIVYSSSGKYQLVVQQVK